MQRAAESSPFRLFIPKQAPLTSQGAEVGIEEWVSAARAAHVAVRRQVRRFTAQAAAQGP